MNAPTDKSTDESRPMADADKQRSGADVGGMAASADGGIRDAMQKKTEWQDETSRGRAATGEGVGAAAAPEPRLDMGGKNEPGSAAGTSAASQRPASQGGGASSKSDAAATPQGQSAGTADPAKPAAKTGAGWDDEEDEWRHEPVAPNDENPVESLGRSVTEAITGSGGKPGKPRQ